MALFSNLIYSALVDLTCGRDARTESFITHYTEFRVVLSEYCFLPLPDLFNCAKDLVALWSIMKLFFIFFSLKPKNLSKKRMLLNLVVAESAWSAICGITCLCYYQNQMILMAGLHTLIARVLINKHNRTCRMQKRQAPGGKVAEEKECQKPKDKKVKAKKAEEVKVQETTGQKKDHKKVVAQVELPIPEKTYKNPASTPRKNKKKH